MHDFIKPNLRKLTQKQIETTTESFLISSKMRAKFQHFNADLRYFSKSLTQVYALTLSLNSVISLLNLFPDFYTQLHCSENDRFVSFLSPQHTSSGRGASINNPFQSEPSSNCNPFPSPAHTPIRSGHTFRRWRWCGFRAW